MSIRNRLARLEAASPARPPAGDDAWPDHEALAFMTYAELIALHRRTIRRPRPAKVDDLYDLLAAETLARLPDAELRELHRRTLGLAPGWDK